MFYDVKILGRRTLLRSFKAINLIIKLNITILKRWIIISPEMVSWWSSWSLIGRIVGCLRLDITVSQTGWLLLRFRNISNWITVRNRNRSQRHRQVKNVFQRRFESPDRVIIKRVGTPKHIFQTIIYIWIELVDLNKWEFDIMGFW